MQALDACFAENAPDQGLKSFAIVVVSPATKALAQAYQGHLRFLETIAIRLYDRGETDQAMKEFQRLQTIDPSDPVAAGPSQPRRQVDPGIPAGRQNRRSTSAGPAGAPPAGPAPVPAFQPGWRPRGGSWPTPPHSTGRSSLARCPVASDWAAVG